MLSAIVCSCTASVTHTRSLWNASGGSKPIAHGASDSAGRCCGGGLQVPPAAGKKRGVQQAPRDVTWPEGQQSPSRSIVSPASHSRAGTGGDGTGGGGGGVSPGVS